MRIFIFKPKSIPKASFYIDYPRLKRGYLRFISSIEDCQYLNGTTPGSMFISYAGLSDRRVTEVIKDYKRRSNAQLLDYDLLVSSKSDLIDFSLPNELDNSGIDERNADRRRSLSL
jgi:hypothetical protein